MVVNYIVNFLDEHKDECQFSLEEILADYTCEKPSDKWILHKLKEKYKDEIIITRLKNQSPIISLKDTGHEILYKAWYENQEKKMEDERIRVVKSAGEIIVEDIRSQIYLLHSYPSPITFLENAEEDVPVTLQTLLETIILKNKRGDLLRWRVIITAISHAIISGTRPRSFISSILTALSSLLLKKYGSSSLLDILSALGFSASYREARVFEISSVLHPYLYESQQGFTQFVFDNVDHQTCTLTGSNTLHAMAGIQCTTPKIKNLFSSVIPRVQKIPASIEVGKFGRIDVLPFQKVNPGIASVKIENLQDLNPLTNDIEVNTVECSWFYEKWQHGDKMPGSFKFINLFNYINCITIIKQKKG
ncbi:hypothetical protein ALC57_01442 [Trachymyrmex cornetzi]|uniref:Uncharacterized protein n=1 Tax=Trachymyrmex cornetzi TaxID=471704 RepID=A0A151JPV8_9HYME|nr:hypothetical protein ALC57_01442 [Trachymyrmex cornetzi]